MPDPPRSLNQRTWSDDEYVCCDCRWPSFAVASRFTAPQPGLTEDDILHIQELYDFDKQLGQRDSELLLSYLTAPYLRIPLVISFFATEGKSFDGNLVNFL